MCLNSGPHQYLCVFLMRLRWLCVCGVEFDSQRESTALMRAAVSGHVDCVRLLIDAGADKDATSDVRCRSLLD